MPLNVWLHDGPHWHLEVFPRTTRLAGLELGAGVYIDPVAPETRPRSSAARRASRLLLAEAPCGVDGGAEIQALSFACLISITVSTASMS